MHELKIKNMEEKRDGSENKDAGRHEREQNKVNELKWGGRGWDGKGEEKEREDSIRNTETSTTRHIYRRG